ncbi:hypothetical protein EJ05DRAFT_516440 [Pseudovirgaria hyperparasitica]|uniref:Uncharacterized protein n=1 Tax=Pseudovirgaria hyperparasitica TaxID=470096 RepID=A0A6A6WLE4_9PEZI|nr:uncharacterized protein EJ05DRAFT_516440 [Pseudovirgaria hyperparasitica]KAF2762992.1 hypothetical protein EJ05DRAFT_516440 [Pseudovirgaria hyperparasitica]
MPTLSRSVTLLLGATLPFTAALPTITCRDGEASHSSCLDIIRPRIVLDSPEAGQDIGTNVLTDSLSKRIVLGEDLDGDVDFDDGLNMPEGVHKRHIPNTEGEQPTEPGKPSTDPANKENKDKDPKDQAKEGDKKGDDAGKPADKEPKDKDPKAHDDKKGDDAGKPADKGPMHHLPVHKDNITPAGVSAGFDAPQDKLIIAIDFKSHDKLVHDKGHDKTHTDGAHLNPFPAHMEEQTIRLAGGSNFDIPTERANMDSWAADKASATTRGFGQQADALQNMPASQAGAATFGGRSNIPSPFVPGSNDWDSTSGKYPPVAGSNIAQSHNDWDTTTPGATAGGFGLQESGATDFGSKFNNPYPPSGSASNDWQSNRAKYPSNPDLNSAQASNDWQNTAWNTAKSQDMAQNSALASNDWQSNPSSAAKPQDMMPNSAPAGNDWQNTPSSADKPQDMAPSSAPASNNWQNPEQSKNLGANAADKGLEDFSQSHEQELSKQGNSLDLPKPVPGPTA